MITVRTLIKHDLATYRRLRLEALENNPEAFGESPAEHNAATEEEAARRIETLESAPQKFVMGAFDGDTLCGTVGFYRESRKKMRHRGIVWGMYVSTAARGKGVGRKLFSELLERCRDVEGLEQLHLWVSVVSPEAEGLYRSFGFAVCGLEPEALRLDTASVDLQHMILFL